MASQPASAPSMVPAALQTRAWGWCAWASDAVERWLEAERDQLPVWLPVCLGLGVAAWFTLAWRDQWLAFLAIAGAVALAGLAIGGRRRIGRVLLVGGCLAAAGLSLAWWRAERVAAPVLARPVLARFVGRVESLEPLPARGMVRMRIVTEGNVGLPPRVRLNVATADMPAGVAPGARLSLRAWLMPPAPPALPGAYDFERVAWFEGIGATGRALAPVGVLSPGRADWRALRERLSAHVRERTGGDAGAIAATLATGDRGSITLEDDEAMRRAGLAHLLSISGLHVTAVVGAAMFVMLRLLALIPWLALRVRLPLVAAGAGALAAVGYTLLTGAEVPTVRSCIAAMLVLAAIALGREAITLRLIATGAFAVLMLWPEALMGPSFQLSFAAVTAIVALHEQPVVRGWFMKRDEGWAKRVAREGASLLLTGLVVEAALAPIALFHFHKSGLYGALANIVAIPLTTFVVMPAEAVALALDLVGLGAPAWWVVRVSLDLMLWIARAIAAAPGAVTGLPTMPDGAFALMAAGGLWLALWRTKWRALGMGPLALGAAWALATPAPDVLVTGDGRHVAVAVPGGGYALLRERAGDYTRSMLGETAGFQGELGPIAQLPGAVCTDDACMVRLGCGAGGRPSGGAGGSQDGGQGAPYLPPIDGVRGADGRRPVAGGAGGGGKAPLDRPGGVPGVGDAAVGRAGDSDARGGRATFSEPRGDNPLRTWDVANGVKGDDGQGDAQGSVEGGDAAQGGRCDRGGQHHAGWRLLATRSDRQLPWTQLAAACAASDIVVSDRRLPRGCTPRWLKLDRPGLATTGGLSITLDRGGGGGTIRMARPPSDHPWRDPSHIAPPRPPYPARRAADKGHSGGDGSAVPAG